MTELDEAAFRTILTEIAQRPPPFRIEEFCFPEQIAFIRDENSYKTAVCSRRAGKTIACAADLLDTALRKPKAASLYITLSRLNAKRIIWAEVLEINRTYKLGGIPHETELSLKFPNGHMIYFSGAKDRSEVEKYRGFPLVKVYIDEAQAFRNYIASLVDDVLSKSLFDYDGTLCLIGTPGPVPVGYFYEASTSKQWSHHGWTMLQNPWLERKSGKPAIDLIMRECKRMGVLPSDPRIQRECFGRWVTDTNSLVFKYDRDKNHFDSWEPNHRASYVIGIDLGYDDADAIAVIGWNSSLTHPGAKPESAANYLVYETTTKKQGITELATQIDALVRRYNPISIVIDSGGLGKKIAEELRKRFGLPVKSAEKSRKFEYIELLNDAMRTGKFFAKSTGIFAQDCLLVEYDKNKSSGDKYVISDSYHSDIADAVLYAYRDSLHYITEQAEIVTPKPHTEEWLKLQEEIIEQALLREAQLDADDPANWSNPWSDHDFE